MSTERDELRGTLSNTICNASFYAKRVQPYLLGSDMSDVLDKTADNLLVWIEERYVPKPRTITTAEGLDELPIDALVLDAYGVGCQKAMEGVWCAAAELITTELVALPATVLDVPEPSL